MEVKEKGTEAGAATPYQFQKEYKGEFSSVKFKVFVKDKTQFQKALTEFAEKSHACYMEMAAEINKKH